ncbi:unnamed protein product [Polarella glacialis]|uniref:Uncharacterized protein n=1 Tax=Polarella glacialis TaxID=89957 RepID=A0A813KZM7_POLGL|nr:unnamed protein product [Polarella glacialis]
MKELRDQLTSGVAGLDGDTSPNPGSSPANSPRGEASDLANGRPRPSSLEQIESATASDAGRALAMQAAMSPRETEPAMRSPPSPSRSRGTLDEEVLRLRRDDGRVFSQLGSWKKTWGVGKTSTDCRLPTMDMDESDPKGSGIDRLLEGRLGVLSRGIRLEGSSVTAKISRSTKRFGITSSKLFTQQIYDAVSDNFKVPRQCVALTGGAFQTPARHRGIEAPEQDIIAVWHNGTVYLFCWLTVEELDHFSSPAGDGLLGQWIRDSMIDEEALRNVGVRL